MAQTQPRGSQTDREHEQAFASGVIWWALMLAKDLETCRKLLRGEHVEAESLRPDWLARAQATRLVRLDAQAIDWFERSL